MIEISFKPCESLSPPIGTEDLKNTVKRFLVPLSSFTGFGST